MVFDVKGFRCRRESTRGEARTTSNGSGDKSRQTLERRSRQNVDSETFIVMIYSAGVADRQGKRSRNQEMETKVRITSERGG